MKIAIRTDADGQHFAADIIYALRWALALDGAQRFQPLAGTVELGMVAHGGFVFRRDAQIRDTDRCLVSAENRCR